MNVVAAMAGSTSRPRTGSRSIVSPASGPRLGHGNRPGKAPVRYFGRFFYTTGSVSVVVPAGEVRIEVAKGLEYRPRSLSTRVATGETRRLTLILERAVDVAALNYDPGDAHLHFPRMTESDDALIFDLLEAEDIRYGAVLAYNENVGPYTAIRERLGSPQLRGLGEGVGAAAGRLPHLLGAGASQPHLRASEPAPA